MAALPPIMGVYGNLGAGKTSLVTKLVHDVKKRSPFVPVCSTVPMALPGPGSFFLCASVGDYIAAGLVFSNFVWSDNAKKIAALPKGALGRAVRRGGIDLDMVARIYEQLQDDYKTVAKSIDWRKKKSIDGWMMAHNHLVLSNALGQGSIDQVGELAERYQGRDFYSMADHVDDHFRFKFVPPHLKFVLVLDEVGVAASADDNTALKQSAFYPWLAQLRKFGGVIMYSGHHPSRVFKQMREVTDSFTKIISVNIPAFRGKIYAQFNFHSEEHYEEFRKCRGFNVHWVSYDMMSRYPTFFMVREPDGLQEYGSKVAKLQP